MNDTSKSKERVLNQFTGNDPYGQFSHDDLEIIFNAMEEYALQQREEPRERVFSEDDMREAWQAGVCGDIGGLFKTWTEWIETYKRQNPAPPKD